MRQPDQRVVVAITLVVGTALLGYGLHSPGDSAGFYGGTIGAAAVWFAGGFAAGGVRWRPPPGAVPQRRQFAIAAGVGVALYGFLVGLDLAVREIPFLDDALDRILSDADRGPLLAVLSVTLLNAVAEEVFFRGAAFTMVDRRSGERVAVVATTVVYVAVTAVSANVVLIAAAVLIGAATAVERRVTGAIGPTVVTHVLWSTLMVTAFPR
jgi:membrane protease YdiL (CAAX protease family)